MICRWSNEAIERAIREVPGFDVTRGAEEFYFDTSAASRAVAFIETHLRHIEGPKAGQPFLLERWQVAIAGNIFGWRHRVTHLRRFREAFIYVPRKNGKTALAAAIVAYILFCDGEYGAQIYSAAADREQAALIYRDVAGMIEQNPTLVARSQVYRTYRSIQNPALNSIYRALSADAKTKHGFNTHAAIIDELHAHPNGDLVDVLKTSTGARAQPLIIYITTADFARESICNTKLQYAKRVRDGTATDPKFLPVIYEASTAEDWKDPNVWRRVNPNYGVSLFPDYLAAEAAQAREQPSYLNTFLRLHLNIQTASNVAWFEPEDWDKCAGPRSWELLPDFLRGAVCYAAIDLASTTDIAAYVKWFPEHNIVVPRFFIPADNIDRRARKDGVPYPAWRDMRALETTPGNVIDHDAIFEAVRSDTEKYRIIECAYDRWNATALVNRLSGEGVKMLAYGQGYASMSGPSKMLEKYVRGAQFAHGHHPVLTWMSRNVQAEIDAAGNVKPSKKKSTEKIDGIVGLVMAIGCAMLKPEAPPSVYETRGLRTL